MFINGNLSSFSRFVYTSVDKTTREIECLSTASSYFFVSRETFHIKDRFDKVDQ